MMLRTTSMARALPLLLLLSACPAASPPSTGACLELPQPSGVELARVGETVITIDQVLARLHEQGGGALRRYGDRDRLREFVEDQIRIELLVRAAIERGLANDPDVVQAARTVMVRKLLERDLGPSLGAGEVSSEAIRTYYDRHRDDYQQPEKRRLTHIQLAPTDTGKATGFALLERLRQRRDDAQLFRQLAVQHSLDGDTRAAGGEMGFVSQEQLTENLGPHFAKTVFTSEAGQLVPDPVQSTRGWHIVRVIARREAVARSLEEVRDDIRERLLRGQRAADFDQYLGEIRRRHPVVLFDARLDELLARLGVAGVEAR